MREKSSMKILHCDRRGTLWKISMENNEGNGQALDTRDEPFTVMVKRCEVDRNGSDVCALMTDAFGGV